MDLLGRAKTWVKGMAPAEPPEPQPFRVACPEGHVIRGRRTEGYQALRCPECGEGVFVLPRSPLPEPPMPAARADRARRHPAGFEEAPIALSDHVPDPMQDDEEIEWLEPVEPSDAQEHGFDPVEAAVADLPTADDEPEGDPPPPVRRRPAAASPRPASAPGRSPGRSGPASPDRRQARPREPRPDLGPRLIVPDRPSLGDRVRRNRPMLVALAVVVAVVGTVAWSVVQNQRRNAPELVRQGREEGIAALDRGEYDRAHRILSKAASAVEALRGQIGGADEVRQAAREAAIFVDLVPDRLEAILDQRARTADETEWQRLFDRRYRGRSILISAKVVGTPSDSAGRFELNYRILAVGPRVPRQARIDFEGFRLFEHVPPELGAQIQIGARLASVNSDGDGWRFLLEPSSGVTITHHEALRSFGWTPVETARIGPRRDTPGVPVLDAPILLTSLVRPAFAQDLRGETPDRVVQRLGFPASHARSASQGEYVEQWVYDGPSGARQYLNFARSTGRSGPAVVEDDFFLR